MNRRLKIIVSALVVCLIAIAVYAVAGNKKNDTKPAESVEKSATQEPTTTSTSEQAQAKQPGSYVTYSEAAVSSASGTKILFFHAPWCPQCRQLDASIKSGTVPDGVTIFKTDYDSNQALRKKYGVTIQTTLAKVDSGGKLIKKYVAYDEPTLESVKQNLLP